MSLTVAQEGEGERAWVCACMLTGGARDALSV